LAYVKVETELLKALQVPFGLIHNVVAIDRRETAVKVPPTSRDILVTQGIKIKQSLLFFPVGN
jgi:hypothetical protein